MPETTGIFFAAMLAAFAVEALLEVTMGIWWVPLTGETRKRVVMAIGTALGVGVALAYKIDLLADLGLAPSIAGQLISGVLIGRGAEWLHAFYKKVKPNA